ARTDVQDRQRLVRPDDDRVGMLLEDLHRDAVVPLVALQDQLRAREVDVALVSGADLLDGQAEDVRPEPLGDDHVRRRPATSRMEGPPLCMPSVGQVAPARASAIRATCLGPVFGGMSSKAKKRTSSASSLSEGVPPATAHSKLNTSSAVSGFQ